MKALKVIKPKEKNMLEIIGESFHGDLFVTLINCPDKKTFKNGRFLFYGSNSNISYINNAFKDEIEWSEEAEECMKRCEDYEEKQKELLILKEEENSSNSIYDKYVFKTKPYAHQFKAFNISKDLPGYALLFEPGCGKSKVIIDNACYLFEKREITALVIIAPNDVHRNWIHKEIKTHLKSDYDYFIWDGNDNEKNKKQLSVVNESKKLRIYSFNIDCFVSEKRQIMLKEILKNNSCLIVIDESQTIKNHKAKRTKFLCKISKMAKYRRICSGTPITNGVENFYSQFEFLDPNIIGVSSFYVFRNIYCVIGHFKQTIGYRNINALQEKVKAYSMRVVKSECLDLPPKTYNRVYFDMTQKQKQLYGEIKKDGIAYIKQIDKNSPVIYTNIMARLTKMKQVTSGYIIDSENNNQVVYLVDDSENPKLNALKELVDNITGKIIIWTCFRADVEMIMRTFKSIAVRYDGSVTGDERLANLENFRSNPKIKLFVANLGVGSTGLTLTEAENCIYFNNSYDLEKRLQSEDRIHRIGTKKSVFYHDMICSKTNDSKIIEVLIQKKKISDMILEDPKSFFMEGENE